MNKSNTFWKYYNKCTFQRYLSLFQYYVVFWQEAWKSVYSKSFNFSNLFYTFGFFFISVFCLSDTKFYVTGRTISEILSWHLLLWTTYHTVFCTFYLWKENELFKCISYNNWYVGWWWRAVTVHWVSFIPSADSSKSSPSLSLPHNVPVPQIIL